MLRICLILATLSSLIPAQTAYVLTRDVTSGGGPGFGVWLPDAAWTDGSFAQHFLRLMMPNYVAASAAGTGTPLPPVGNEGGLAIDPLTNIVYATDGLAFLTQDSHSHYPTGATPAPAASLPLAGGPSGPITGLAVDADAGILWICDGSTFQARSKVYPYPVAGPVLPIPPFPGLPGATGIGFDPANSHLWATNVDGATVEFTAAGAPISMHPPIPVPHAAIRGLDVNPTNGLGSIPPYLGQTGGYHVCVTDGDRVFDALPPYGSIDAFSTLPSHCRGLAISCDPSLLPGRFNTISGVYQFTADPANAGFAPVAGLSRSSYAGASATPCAVTLDGAPAGSLVYLLGDLTPLPITPSGGGVVVGNEVLWINPFSTTFGILSLAADPAGKASVPLPLGGTPAGLQFVLQWAVPSAGAYLGLVFTDALPLKVGLR